MAELPSASVVIDDEAGAFAGSTGYAVVIAAVATNADATPRVYSSGKAVLDQHGYSQGADYASLHIQKTKRPIIFVGIPIVTAGVAGSFDSSTVLGTSRVTVTADTSGYLEEIDGLVTVVTGGTIGTAGIVLTVSCDGGWSEKTVRLLTATTYTIPYTGAILNFGAGTLVAGDVFRFRTTAPLWDSAGLASARTALAAQQKLARSWMVIGEIATSTQAGYITTQANAYETSNDRFVYARTSVADRNLAKASKVVKRMVGAPSLTFAEVGATGDTITRATGSWVTDGFVVNDLINVSGTTSNNFTNALVTAVSATVLTLDTQDLTAEVTSAASVSAAASYTFAEVGATGDTITRSSGSFVADGFAAGDFIDVLGTSSNNFTNALVTAVSATVLTLDTQDLVAETIRSDSVTIVKRQTKAAWIALADAAFATVDGQRRIDLSAGRARIASPITGWSFRRPAAWAASVREYAHDLHIPCWRKADGPLDGWDLTDGSDQVVEFDERVDGGALAGRFTCFRTWANGPNGAYLALSLTRAPEGSLLSRTHNMAVANLACSVAQAETEQAVGQSLVLNADGTGTDESLQRIEERVNTALQRNLLQQGQEGQRASRATWKASRTDLLNTPGATLNGVLSLVLNGTIEQIATRVRIETAA